jgi:2-keto-3-deoxy-L-rhamnonate aldolase RhmA
LARVSGSFAPRSSQAALAAAGFQWAFLDTEHGGFDLETIQDICRVASMAGLCPIVRVADLQYSLVARAFDVGAQGVIFPRVESPELLERAVSWTKFRPPACVDTAWHSANWTTGGAFQRSSSIQRQ